MSTRNEDIAAIKELLKIADAASRFEYAIRHYGVIVPDPMIHLHDELHDALVTYRADFPPGPAK